MVAIYVALIMAGRRSVESVPGNLKAAVQAELETRGLEMEGELLRGK